MKKNLTTILSTGLLAIFVSVTSVFAQESGFTTVGSLISTFTATVVKSVGTLFIALAVVAFLFGIVQYIWGLREGDAKKVKDGNSFMIWGLVALFVMFSVYGIISLAQGVLFNGKLNNNIVIPEIKLSPKLTAPAQTGAPASQGQPASALSGQGGSCSGDAQCQSGLFCPTGTCLRVGDNCSNATVSRGVVRSDGSCGPQGTSASLAEQGARCGINVSCQSGLFCVTGTCKKPGDTCTTQTIRFGIVKSDGSCGPGR